MWHEKVIEVLKDHYTVLKKRNDRYSLRSFAHKLGISSSALSELFTGKRRLSKSRAQTILERLALAPTEHQRLLAIMAEPRPIQGFAFDPSESSLLDRWWHLAILNYFEIDGAEASTDAISLRLHIPVPIVTESLALLERSKLIGRDSKNRFVRIHSDVSSSDNIPSEKIREFHRSGLELAKEALDLPLPLRDITSLVFPMNLDAIDEVRQIIRESYQRIMLAAGRSPRTDVYRITCALHPMTAVRASSLSDQRSLE